MNRIKQARRDAKKLFRLCHTNGLLDEGRVRLVVHQVHAARNRNRLNVLLELLRLAKIEVARRTATVESAMMLSQEMQVRIRMRLEQIYGIGIQTSFVQSPGLIGGMRIKVGSDVFDNSVLGKLVALEASF